MSPTENQRGLNVYTVYFYNEKKDDDGDVVGYDVKEQSTIIARDLNGGWDKSLAKIAGDFDGVAIVEETGVAFAQIGLAAVGGSEIS